MGFLLEQETTMRGPLELIEETCSGCCFIIAHVCIISIVYRLKYVVKTWLFFVKLLSKFASRGTGSETLSRLQFIQSIILYTIARQFLVVCTPQLASRFPIPKRYAMLRSFVIAVLFGLAAAQSNPGFDLYVLVRQVRKLQRCFKSV